MLPAAGERRSAAEVLELVRESDVVPVGVFAVAVGGEQLEIAENAPVAAEGGGHGDDDVDLSA